MVLVTPAPGPGPRPRPAMPPPAPPTDLVPSERAVVLLSCALSALGSSLLVATHALWPDLRSQARRLLLFLSLADLLSAASYFYGVLQDFSGSSWDCVLQGALSTFANTSSFFWTVAIALYLYLSIVHGAREPRVSRLFWAFHIVSWGVPLAITIAAVTLKKIGYDASYVSVGWCWISLEAEDHLLWMLLTGKLWELLAYITLPLLYLLIRKHVNRAHEALSEYRPILSEVHQLQRHASVADRKLIFIPLIFICLRVWSTVRFVLTLCGSPAVRTPVLVVLHGIGNTFQGGANCIMFVFCTQAVRTRLFSFCCCCSSQPTADSPARLPQAPPTSQIGEPQGAERTPSELPGT